MLNPALKEKLKEAFEIRAERESERYAQMNLDHITFSPEFGTRLDKQLKRHDNFWYRRFNTVGKRVAAIIVLVVGIMAATTFGVEALREPFLNFVAETFEKFTKITFHQQDSNEEESFAPLEPVDPSYIPEGYTLMEENVNVMRNMKIYRNSEGNQISYSQKIKDGAQSYLDSEEGLTEKININGNEGILITESDEIIIYFVDEHYVYNFYGNIEKEELFKMAESIFEKK